MNRLFYWLGELFSLRNYTLRNYTVFLLVLFCIQYIPVESRAGVSWVKVGVMAITACMMLKYILVNKGLIIAIFYALWIILTAYVLHPLTFRASTVIYLFMYVTTFVAFYTFVWNYHVFSLDFFINVLRRFIFVLVGVLIAQQICLIIGLKLVPILNLCQVLNRGIGANSLTFEPSTLGRLISVLYYSYLKCNEYRRGAPLNITEVLHPNHKWVTIAYVWAVMTMGSGTAFLAMALVALYFMRGRYLFLAIPMFMGVYFILDYFGNESFQRTVNVSQVTLTADREQIMEVDGSAATRIVPVVNTLNLDLSSAESWTGRGCDSVPAGGNYSKNRYMGQISDYGLISYLLELLLIFTCCIRFLSIPTLMFFLGVGGGIGNISYGWGVLMIFTCVRFFAENYSPGYEDVDNEEQMPIEELDVETRYECD